MCVQTGLVESRLYRSVAANVTSLNIAVCNFSVSGVSGEGLHLVDTIPDAGWIDFLWSILYLVKAVNAES